MTVSPMARHFMDPAAFTVMDITPLTRVYSSQSSDAGIFCAKPCVPIFINVSTTKNWCRGCQRSWRCFGAE